MKKLSITILTFFLFFNFLTSQTTELIKGREFIVHKVVKGETAYGISKHYEVPMDTIFAYNSTAVKGVKTDQILKFPSKNAMSGIKYIKHTVSQGETLSSIAKKYKVSVDEIRKANTQITNVDVLKLDDVLNIPVTNGNNTTTITNNQTDNTIVIKETIKEDVKPDNNTGGDKYNDEVICDTIKTLKKNYNIALILPFKGNNFASSKIATEFYYGFKVALDSVVAKMKVGVKLYVMNSTATNDSDKTTDQYDFDKLKKMDLIIGPLFSANIKPIAQFALENKIPIVSPFTKSLSLLEGNPFVIKITPSEKTLAKRTLSYFNTTYPNCNFILVNTNTRRDSTLHLAYSDALDEMGITDTNRIHKINTKTASPSSYFKGGVKNVVIYLNSKEVTVKAFITGFNKAHKGTDISLVGTEGWLEFNNVEADYYMNLNLHIPVATYADFTDSTKYDYFIRKYQNTVKADPTDYSFTGYKIGSDFMRRFFTYGSNICNCIDQYKVPADEDEKTKLPFNFWFERRSDADGWENNSIQILRIEEDYILDIVNY
jgi:LysM repeat protein/ABC-type branched-subunit amino acid transport system substrate-binding protein